MASFSGLLGYFCSSRVVVLFCHRRSVVALAGQMGAEHLDYIDGRRVSVCIRVRTISIERVKVVVHSLRCQCYWCWNNVAKSAWSTVGERISC
jgi:hypothetical protein